MSLNRVDLDSSWAPLLQQQAEKENDFIALSVFGMPLPEIAEMARNKDAITGNEIGVHLIRIIKENGHLRYELQLLRKSFETMENFIQGHKEVITKGAQIP